MNDSEECPVCGARMQHKYYDSVIYCGKDGVNVKLSGFECSECGWESGDNKENDRIVKKAYEDASVKCAIDIIKDFKNKKQNLSEIERVYSLPVRTLSKWMNKEKKPSAAAVTLLRIISAFPWMTKAVDTGLETEDAIDIARQYYYTEFNTSDKQILFLNRQNSIYVAAKINKPYTENRISDNSFLNDSNGKNLYAVR